MSELKSEGSEDDNRVRVIAVMHDPPTPPPIPSSRKLQIHNNKSDKRRQNNNNNPSPKNSSKSSSISSLTIHKQDDQAPILMRDVVVKPTKDDYSEVPEFLR